MKYYLTIIVFLFVVTSCSKKVTYNQVESTPNVSSVQANSSDDGGTIILESSGSGQTFREAQNEAIKAAFRAILFIGVPGTAYRNPMIPNAEESQKSNQIFYEEFFNVKYSDFVMNVTELKSGNKDARIRVKINCNSLRMYLESKKIIRKLGY